MCTVGQSMWPPAGEWARLDTSSPSNGATRFRLPVDVSVSLLERAKEPRVPVSDSSVYSPEGDQYKMEKGSTRNLYWRWKTPAAFGGRGRVLVTQTPGRSMRATTSATASQILKYNVHTGIPIHLVCGLSFPAHVTRSM